MQVSDGMPGRPLRRPFAEHVVPCRPHLGRAAVHWHPASRCREPRAEDPPDLLASGGIVGQHCAERRPESQIGVGGVRNRLGHPHCRRTDASRDLGAAGLDNDSAADRQLTAVLGCQQRLQPAFQRKAELVGVDGIDAAVHEAETVRRADDRIRGNVDGRVAGKGARLRREDVSLADTDSRYGRKCFLPCRCQGGAEVAKMNLKDRHPARISHLIASVPLLRHHLEQAGWIELNADQRSDKTGPRTEMDVLHI